MRLLAAFFSNLICDSDLPVKGNELSLKGWEAFRGKKDISFKHHHGVCFDHCIKTTGANFSSISNMYLLDYFPDGGAPKGFLSFFTHPLYQVQQPLLSAGICFCSSGPS